MTFSCAMPIPALAPRPDGHQSNAVVFCSGANPNLADVSGMTPLHVAVQQGQAETLDLLIAAGVDIKAKHKQGLTALELAIDKDDGSMVKAIAKTDGWDANVQNGDGATLLHTAALAGKEKAIKALVASGADVEMTDADGATALHAAAFSGVSAVVKALLAAGADASAEDHEGEKPTDIADAEGHKEIVRMLKEAGKSEL